MKSLIQIVLVALVMGGVSAAGSIYWKQWIAPAVPAVAQTDPAAAPKVDGKAGDQPQEADPAHSNRHANAIRPIAHPPMKRIG